MALTDVIDRLAAINEEQLVETQDIKVEMESLTDRVTELLELNKQDRLDRLEAMREGVGFEAPSMTAGGAGGSGAGGGGGGLLGGLMSSLLGFFGLKAFLGTLATFSGKLLKMFKGVGRFLGPVGLIITGIIATFATIEGFLKGYEEGGVLGGLEGAFKGFVDNIIAAPLDLLTDAVAHVARMMGFTETADALKKFSFAETFDKIITVVFNVIENSINFVKELFADPKAKLEELWDGLKNLLGVDSLIDLIFLPIDKAVNWVKGIFNFGDPDKPFNLSTFIENMIANTVQLFTNIFQGLINRLRSIPVLSEFFKSDQEKALDAEIKALNEKLSAQDSALNKLGQVTGKAQFDLSNLGDPTATGFFARLEAGVRGSSLEQEQARILAEQDRLTGVLQTAGADRRLVELAKKQLEQNISNLELERQQIQSGMAVQQLNSMAGASGGGTTVYQTTNNITQGGGAGSSGSPNASSSTATASNDHVGTLDATQFISGGPTR